ncbi:MAG TPA: YbhB/YbcL family Raf kinase inhibitor-like protein [Candidatus Limnocylindria bacterium]|nr:YbhB/YbcL family Raf kinase inhibitor-like protein [Candidatus Limnocylindria bacterium]
MKKFLLIGIILLFAVIAGFLFFKSGQQKNVYQAPQKVVNTQPMKITSPVFNDHENIPAKYTCDGDGVNPPLAFSDVPKEAKTLALVMDDPDAPNGTWVHWLLWNIPAETNQLMENSVPAGATQGQTSSGQNVYGGPCPPLGIHHYHFKLYALSRKLSIASYSTAADLEKAMQGNIIAHADLVGLYSRNK